MGAAFPELGRGQDLIIETLKLEEGRFKKTLENGIKLLDDATANMKNATELNGDTAFKLYDTYGFPLDLTQDALRGRGITVDVDGFNTAMERQRAEARKAWSGSGDAADEAVWFDVRDEVGATEFLGYKIELAEGQVMALVVDGKKVQMANPGDKVAVIVNQTPFYGESGGQMGDTGQMHYGEMTLIVTDTRKLLGELHVHYGEIVGDALNVGDDVLLKVDHQRRAQLKANHSATHLLHEALRRKLGGHVTQKGSLVASDRLRFDISHPKPVEAHELLEVEAHVNSQITNNAEVNTRLMEPEVAVEAGAMALFGEKYGDEVRVVSIGADGNDSYSTELCGGTHVHRTGDIGVFKILNESAVASGVRRIEALTGDGARAYFANTEYSLMQAASLLKSKPADVPNRIEALIEDRRKLEREITEVRRQLVAGGSSGTTETKNIGGVTYSPKLMDGVPAKELKGFVDEFKNQLGSGVVAIVSNIDGKASLVVGVTDDLKGRLSAVDLVRAGSVSVGGKGGGGRSDMAQAGGPDGHKGQAALDAIEAMISQN